MSDKKMPAVIALGYFDSVHLGHRKIIEAAAEYARKNGAEPVIVTFNGNLKAALHGQEIRSVYTTEERKGIYASLGVNEVVFEPIDKEFLSLSKNEFLDRINARYGVLAYFCGQDYRFGINGSGSAESVQEYAAAHGQKCFVCKLLENGGEKISTTLIKQLLFDGQLERANELLGRKYSISGVVFKDREVGKKLGFPTVNIKLESEKQRLKDGVYAGSVAIENKRHKAIINYGARPTFDLKEKLVEAHIVDFEGNLYGEKLTLYFHDYLRDIIKFSSEEQLIEQLKNDLQKVKGMDYD